LVSKKKTELYDVVKSDNSGKQLNDESFTKVKKILAQKQTLQKRVSE